MNTGELNEKTGDNNEDKNSEDIKNQNVIKEIETELSNKEIIDNIGSQSPAVDMPNEKEDDNDNPADNHNEVLDTNKIIPTISPPPNDGSESHDEDLILRWDDDDETTNQEKIDENIHHDLESFGNSFGIDKTEACAPIEDEDKANKVENITEDIAEDDSIDFLKQQLKVLSESINPNLNTHAIDVPNLLGSEFGAPSTSKSIVDADDDFGETVACKESASLDTEIGSNSRQDVDANEMVVNEKIEADCSQDENIKLDIQDDSNIKTNNVVGDVETENVFKDAERSISDEENSLNDAVDDFIKDVKPGTSNVALENNEAINTEKTEIETEGSINSVNIEKSVEEIEENRSEITTVAVTENITEDTINKPLDVEVTDNVADGTLLDDNLTKKEGDTNDTESMQLDPKIKEDSPEAIENIENIREESIKETNANSTPEDTSIINDNSTNTKIKNDIKEFKSAEGDTQKIVEIVDASETGTDITNIDTEVTTEETKMNPGIEEMEVDITEAIDAEPSDVKFDQCESYIDLSSQSPISLDETSDTEKPIDTQIDDKESKNENKSSNEDPNYYNVKSDHRLRPDVMIEIPSQSLLDVDMEESIDIDSEDASQEAETKTEETKDYEEKVENNDAEKKEDSKQLVETNRLPLNEEDKLDSDIIDVDLDDDSNEEVASDDKIDNKLNDNSNDNEDTNKDSVMEANKITEQKDISNNEERTKEAKSDENADDIIDLDDYEVSEVNNFVESDNSNRKNEESNKEVKDDVEPSMSSECVRRLTPDASDEVAEVSDSLGLLAESSRVRRDEGDEEFDEDDDYDQDDESSNQMTADHSEDSNAQHSESDSKGQGEKTPEEEARAFNFTPAEVGESPKAVVEEQVKKPADSSSKPAVEDSSSTDKNLEEIGPNEQDLAKSPDIETVKLDNSDDEAEQEKDKDENTQATTPEKTAPSPSKTKKLEIANPRHILNIVDLEESSSEEDVQEVAKPPPQDEQVEETEDKERETPSDVTSVNIPTEIEIMSTSCGNTSEIVTKEGEVVITGVPKPPPHKPARLNTSEVTIKTAPASMESTLIIPETKMQTKPKMGLEIFSLDSDDEDIGTRGKGGRGARLSALELDAALRSGRCLRRGCGAGARGGGALAHYCDQCAATHYRRTQELVEGIKNMTPLLDLNMEKLSQDLVEISDSDSETESKETKDTIGQAGAEMLHENLADIMNGIWKKYKMDTSLDDAKVFLNIEVEKLESESKEINKMLNDCQTATDKLRRELYATFEPQRLELPPVNIVDNSEFTILLTEIRTETNMLELKPGKRRLSATNPNPAKRPAIPMGYTPLDPETVKTEYTTMLRSGGVFVKAEEDKEISVVQLSAEAAPPDLPGAGEARRAALRPGMVVYAMRNAFGAWTKARILDQVKIVGPPTQFPSFRVRFENKVKNPCKVLSARCLAYQEPPDVRLTIGTRVIALFKESANVNKRESYYSGIVAEIPNPVNNYRYLVFFDDGYAQYAAHAHTRVVCACAAPVWEEVHPFSREFVRNYLCAYPERPMVRLHAGQKLNTEWNGKWWDSTVIQVDASLVQVHFEEDNRTEWIYRGSTRLEPLFLELQAAVKPRSRHVPRTKAQMSVNMPYVEYTRSYEQDKSTIEAQQEELRRQRAVAKKSTTVSTPGVQEPPEPYTSRVVYYTPRNAVRPYKMVPHTCGPKCKRSDVLTLKELKSYNPLAKPLLSGWERQLVRHKGSAAVLYRAPCGRRVRSAAELHRYLRATRADMPVDLFDFNPDTHCLAEFVLSKCVVGKKDLSHGKENVPVPCVNNVDDSLPEFCSYNTERTPTAGVPLNLDPEFLCGCDCTDDCADKTKCACWKLTLEGAKTIGLEGPNVGYDFKRLPEPLPSGIYECNVRCKCRHTCLNRVAQHPLQLKLQVFKTPNRGWGIRALNDVPKGAFLCVYAGNLLTDATANLDGLNEGDEYLAELDYIEVVEQMKEGYEDDVPEADKELDKKESVKKEEKSEEEESSSEEDEEAVSKNEEEDDDFLPGYIGPGVMTFNKRLRKRGKVKEENKEGKAEIKEVKAEMKEEPDKEKDGNGDEECITISDDEEVREPSRFAAQAEMGVNEHVPKYRSVRSHFGKDEACYIMDAKVQGNIGRYLNHSCSPNVFVQNVFVDTHDPRFPWVAFFALAHIRAGTELTWNYNYDVGSVPGKVLYCYCGAPNCRRRLL